MTLTLYYGWDKPNDGDGLRNGKPWGDKIRKFLDDTDSLFHNLSQVNPMTAANDIIVGGIAGAMTKLSVGQTGQVLTVLNTGLVGWANPGGGGSGTGVPIINSGTTGKVLSNDGTNSIWIANPIPSVVSKAGQFLTNNGTTVNWTTISQMPTITSGTAGYFLTNDGSGPFWTPGLSNPMSTYGDIIVGGLSGTPTKLIIGTVGQVLTVYNISGHLVPYWTTPTIVNPMTSYGDLVIGGASGIFTKLAIGTPGQVLSVYDTGVGHYSLQYTTVLTNPMTTTGDLIVGGTVGAPVRLGIGAANTVLCSNGSTISWSTVIPPMAGNNGKFLSNNGSASVWSDLPISLPTMSVGTNEMILTNDGSTASWVTNTAGFTNPMTTTGDMISANSGGAAARLAIGTAGQVLMVVSGGPSWQTLNLNNLPTQTGHAGQFLKTDATTASWTTINQVPTAVGVNGKFLGSDGTNYSFMDLPNPIPSMTGQIGKFLSNNGGTLNWTPITVLPSITGQTGKVLSTDGTSVMWISQASSASLGTLPVTFTSSSLTVGQSEIDTVPIGCLSFQLQAISVNCPCRIRIYGTNADAIADLARPSTQDPGNTVAIFAEMVFISTYLSIPVIPQAVICFNGDTIQTSNLYMTIQNTSSSTSAITITATILKME